MNIETPEEYDKACREFDDLAKHEMDPEEDDRMKELAIALDAYEAVHVGRKSA